MLSEHSSQSIRKSTRGLNPCFNGRYSQSVFSFSWFVIKTVLILVLMEDTLRACKAVRLVLCEVLILVVMEDTLREFLNPLSERLKES